MGVRLAIAGVGALLGVVLLARGAVLIGAILLTMAALRFVLFFRLSRLGRARLEPRRNIADRRRPR
jgi:hypothetical protein